MRVWALQQGNAERNGQRWTIGEGECICLASASCHRSFDSVKSRRVTDLYRRSLSWLAFQPHLRRVHHRSPPHPLPAKPRTRPFSQDLSHRLKGPGMSNQVQPSTYQFDARCHLPPLQNQRCDVPCRPALELTFLLAFEGSPNTM